jgi:hypothetical protein
MTARVQLASSKNQQPGQRPVAQAWRGVEFAYTIGHINLDV